MKQLPKSVGFNNMYLLVLMCMSACVCILKGICGIVSGRVDVGFHSLEKLTVSLAFQKCYPVTVRLWYFIAGLTNWKCNEVYKDVTVDFNSSKIGCSEDYVGILSMDSSFTNMSRSFRLMGHVYYSHISD